ncbi:MAG TPA: YigZ family protein [Clostridiaceae bacterium]|nr:YigZ family protein [Clostridiaceae bacterium]
MEIEYKTVLKEAVAEFEEKKSKFIASVKPVSKEEEALEFINRIKSRYWDATHNVYAYYIGGDVTTQRFSDDGEPSGTAGMPVLEVIKRMDVRDLVVVVTRYFGGTLLGATGLVRAYSKSATLGIEAAGIVKKSLCTEVKAIVEYTLWGKVQNLIQKKGYPVNNISYGQDIDISIFVPVGEADDFLILMEEETNGRAVTELGEKMYVPMNETFFK